ncbi:MAG: biotin--[acetyl-CoA-carboxylase] ligase [Rhodospirillales bacterium]
MAGLTLPPAYAPVMLDVCGSTNDEAKRLAELGATHTPDGTLIWALSQTKGRGRRGRAWASPPGNLYVSLVLRPDAPPAKAAELGFAAALAISDALNEIAPGLQIRCKWPNDVLIDGAKVAGVLMETSGGETADWVVLGAGLNVVSHPEDTEFPATSLRAKGIEDVDAQTVLESFARHFLTWRERWRETGFAPLREAWLTRAHTPGEPIRVRTGGREFSGRFHDLDSSGALIVETGTGPVTVAAGDVFFDAGVPAQDGKGGRHAAGC